MMILGGPNWGMLAFSQQMMWRVVFLNYPRCTIKITGYLWWINKYFAKSSCSCSSHANFMIIRSCLPAMDHGFSRLQTYPNSNSQFPEPVPKGAPEPLWRHHTCGQPSLPSTFWIMSWSHPVLSWWPLMAIVGWSWMGVTLSPPGCCWVMDESFPNSPGSGFRQHKLNFPAKSRSYFVSWFIVMTKKNHPSERIQTTKNTQESQQKTFKNCLPFCFCWQEGG